MLGIEDYGSDDESLKESSLPPSTFSLPLPSSPSLPLPSSSTSHPKLKRIKKIAINLPSLPPSADDDDDSPPAKKPRVTPNAGAGKSSLLGMLPAPRQSVPVIEKKKKVERVLGGGGGPGLVFRTSKSSDVGPPDDADLTDAYGPSVDANHGGEADVQPPPDTSESTSFLPPSLKKGRFNISLDNEGGPSRHQQPHKLTTPAVNFFSLGSSMPPARPTPTLPSSAPAVSTVPSVSSFIISSAPAISTFRPPSPTLDDPYPGYYELPSGAYAPYDAEYYASYAKKWKAEYDKHIRALEKSQYEFADKDGAQDVDMAAEMEKARREIKEREDKKMLTAGKFMQNENGEVPMPRMNVKGAKLGTVARSRHQLTTLLTEAYLNREALEERISQGRRNRKEAGNKYGF